jgi:hypothetical protein
LSGVKSTGKGPIEALLDDFLDQSHGKMAYGILMITARSKD